MFLLSATVFVSVSMKVLCVTQNPSMTYVCVSSSMDMHLMSSYSSVTVTPSMAAFTCMSS